VRANGKEEVLTGLHRAASELRSKLGESLNKIQQAHQPLNDAVNPAKVMLAVLPFENLTGDAEQEYLSDGMTEEMITQLGQLQPEQLGVIARTSVMGYKHNNHIDQIARELGVQYLVEGCVRRSGDRLRITTQVIQVKDRTQLWAGTYDRNAADILRFQSDVAAAVTGAIRLKLTPQKRTILASARIVNPQAYDAYLRGRYMLDRRTVEGFQKAVVSLLQSIDADPNFALAYAAWITSETSLLTLSSASTRTT